VFLIMIFNPELELLMVAFEVFSAFSTVGLSLGINCKTQHGKIKLLFMLVMFFG